MSGRSVAPILEQHGGDVYITGSTVVRHKVVNGRECDVFPVDYDTQLVLTAKHLYKLRQPLLPPPATTTVEKQQEQGVQEEHQSTKMEDTNKRATAAAAVVQPPSPKLVWCESLGLVRAVIPLHNHPFHEWAAAQNIPCHNYYGFAIEYFNPHTTGPKPASKQTTLQRYMKEKRCQCVNDVFADVQLTSTGNSKNNNNSNGGLRVREFHVGLIRPPPNTPQATGDGSLFLQQDWCHAFRVGRMNYWHERLEDHLIEEPEVFQYQIFAMEFPSDNNDLTATTAASGKVRPLLCQLVLSTERLYVVPRYDAKLLSLELPLHHPEMRSRWFTVAALQSISIDLNKGIIVCIGQQQQQQQQQEKRGNSAAVKSTTATMSTNSSSAGGGAAAGGGEKGVKLTLGFFDTAEAEEAVLEIQRVWDLTHRNDDFPLV